jgi:hypothetical protein
MACLQLAESRIALYTCGIRILAREYSDLPGLSLTIPQVQRLLGVDRELAQGIVAVFTDAGCLFLGGDGRLRRPSDHPGTPASTHVSAVSPAHCSAAATTRPAPGAGALHYEMRLFQGETGAGTG